MDNGWIKLFRSLWDNPVVTVDADHVAVWIWLLCNATHKPHDTIFAGKRITLQPGQLITGRRKVARETKVDESKVYRILKRFKSEQQIEQRTDRQCSLISILNWDKYQQSEQRNEQRVNNDCTTSEQRVNTKQECKNDKNGKNERSVYGTRTFKKPSLDDLEAYAAERTALGHVQIDVHRFYDYYNSNGWRVGKNPMKDWKAAYRTWERKEEQDRKGASAPGRPGTTGEFRYMRNGKMVTINE